MIMVIQDYGASIGKRSNCILVKSSKGIKEVSAEKISELHVYPSCSISSDAIQLCMKNDIWILFLDFYGNPKGEILPFSGGNSPIYKRKQLLLPYCSVGVNLVKGFLEKKISNRILQIEELVCKESDMDSVHYLSTRVRRMKENLEKIRLLESDEIHQIRDSLQGLEGSAGRAYFECVSWLLPEEMKFRQRKRQADDVYNCTLNYLYGVLYAKVKQLLYQCRLDPYIGVMHADQYNQPTFVFDAIEGFRIICERLAFDLCKSREIGKCNMKEQDDGTLLFDESARKCLTKAFYETMNEPVMYNGYKTVRERVMYLELLDVAKKIGEVDNDLLAVV